MIKNGSVKIKIIFLNSKTTYKYTNKKGEAEKNNNIQETVYKICQCRNQISTVAKLWSCLKWSERKALLYLF